LQAAIDLIESIMAKNPDVLTAAFSACFSTCCLIAGLQPATYRIEPIKAKYPAAS
jgi:hypothetical protein